MPTVVLPGIGGSGETHWQTLWEAEDPSFKRFAPSNWDAPDLADWIEALDRSLSDSEEPPVLIAHSLACLLVAHAAPRIASKVGGAFLVAVPDPDGPSFPAEASSFGMAPSRPLSFPSLIVASGNDPYGSLDYARRRAREWNAGFVEMGNLGHINGSSGLGSWMEGRRLYGAFRAGLRLGSRAP